MQNSNLLFNYNKMNKRNTNKINKIILHHRAGKGDVESIHQQHIKRGWAGIGYHFYIRENGEVFAGRPVDYVGAHCPGSNQNSIGICFEGDFTKGEPSIYQIAQGMQLIKDLKTKYKGINKVFNHRDLCKTLCPGIDLANLLEV